MDAHIPPNQAPPTKLDFNILQEAANIVKDNWQAYGLFALISMSPLVVALIAFQTSFLSFFLSKVWGATNTQNTDALYQSFSQAFSMIVGLQAFGLVVMSFVAGGVIRMTLLALQGHKPDFKDGFMAVTRYPALFGATVVMAFLSMLGYCFCIIGTYVVITFCLLTFPVLMNENLSITASIQRSAELLKGQSLLAFAIFFVSQLIVNASAFAFNIPLLVTIPWLFVVITLMYRNLAGLPGATGVPITPINPEPPRTIEESREDLPE